MPKARITRARGPLAACTSATVQTAASPKRAPKAPTIGGLPLMLLALGGLGLAARRRRAA